MYALFIFPDIQAKGTRFADKRFSRHPLSYVVGKHTVEPFLKQMEYCMATKNTLKKKKTLDRRLRKRAGQRAIISDMGEYLQEFLLRGLYIFSLNRGQNSIQKATARIHALLQDKDYNKIISLLNLDKIPRERAQIMAYQGLAAQDRDLAEKYIGQALRLDPRNVDALSWKARMIFEADPTQQNQALVLMREIIAFAEKQLGPQLKTQKGKIHDFPMARPYLRALNMLFGLLDSMGLSEEALNTGQKMLTLCGPDMFSIRPRIEEMQAALSTKIQGKIPGEMLQETSENPEPELEPNLKSELKPELESDPEPELELSEEQACLFNEISQKTDVFCQTHLDENFKKHARKAVSMLCRDKNCAVHRGKRESWASGVMHALIQANRVFEAENPLHIQPVIMQTFFKVSSSTTTKKSSLIRKCLNISPDNPAWQCHD